MKAKFVYEAMGDVLKPKSEEEILALMGNLSPNQLLAQSSEKGFLGGVKKALKMGADVNRALIMPSLNGHYDVVELLLKNGANVHIGDDLALHWASAAGNYNIVELLLKYGANAHADNDDALRWASKNGHYAIVELLKKYM